LDSLAGSGCGSPPAPCCGSAALGRRAGVFVTIRQRGELRGCIGDVDADRPLSEAVPELTIAAATKDPRFAPVTRGESGLDVEISVLTPLKRIASPDTLVAGEHGAVIEYGKRRGLLLPQVASERGWTTRDFLRALTRKAGLPDSAINNPVTRLWTFRVQTFGGATTE
jgi:AmmeMemoRadiSam system protein A